MPTKYSSGTMNRMPQSKEPSPKSMNRNICHGCKNANGPAIVEVPLLGFEFVSKPTPSALSTGSNVPRRRCQRTCFVFAGACVDKSVGSYKFSLLHHHIKVLTQNFNAIELRNRNGENLTAINSIRFGAIIIATFAKHVCQQRPRQFA